MNEKEFALTEEFMKLSFKEAGYCSSLLMLYEYIDREIYYTPFESAVKDALYPKRKSRIKRE